MQIGALTTQLDVAQMVLIAFFLFFAGLIIYLQRESNREGLPLVDDYGRRTDKTGVSGIPSPKVYLMPHGEPVISPRLGRLETLPPTTNQGAFIGAPLEPTGNRLLSGLGPAAYANRADVPDLQFVNGLPRIVPLRSDDTQSLAVEDADPRGMNMVGADDEVAGTISDVWVDRSENVARYLEVTLVPSLGGRHVLVPLPMVDLQPKHNRAKVYLILGEQFADVPGTKNPEEITLLEEDKIAAYYGGGMLYATPARAEPLI
jgi:photosynthetic reaction center H subunit